MSKYSSFFCCIRIIMHLECVVCFVYVHILYFICRIKNKSPGIWNSATDESNIIRPVQTVWDTCVCVPVVYVFEQRLGNFEDFSGQNWRSVCVCCICMVYDIFDNR